ncbi:unnamed protein product [Closterium sp. NIES-64]|nr:unnamed protein product [Closterium sp. NIES-64]
MLCYIYTLACSLLSSVCMGTEKWEGLDVCEQFSLQQMVKATNNWSDDNVLGKGGFGIVYQGYSPHGHLWAINRSTVMTNDFEAENVETGKQEQILVYEFVGNRDMEYHIHRTKTEGLAYLHGFETPIVNRDIKPANILVTADMHAKVADFGLLKLLTHGDADATRVAGTPGYVDPDYNRTNIITAKSDVFSFGIVLLELLTGKSPQMVEAYDLDQLKDSKMPAVSEEAIVNFADLALDCIKSPGTRRPTMKDVAYRLSGLIEKHCPDKEDEWEGTGKETCSSTEELCSGNDSAVSYGGSGMDSQQSQGGYFGVSSFVGICSITSGIKSWLQVKPN